MFYLLTIGLYITLMGIVIGFAFKDCVGAVLGGLVGAMACVGILIAFEIVNVDGNVGWVSIYSSNGTLIREYYGEYSVDGRVIKVNNITIYPEGTVVIER